MTAPSSPPEASPPDPPQREIPAHAGREREAQSDYRAELQCGDMQHGDPDAKPEQAPATISDHGGGCRAADARMQDQHHAAEHHGEQRDDATDIRTDPPR